MTILIFIAGLITLVAGAHVLVRGASGMAISFGISPLVVGLTIVAFGTSAPELAVSISSAWSGQVDLALGNAVGSNIFNVFFVLGISALVAPLLVAPQLIRQEVPVLIAACLLLFGLSTDGRLGRIDGLILFALVCVYTLVLIRQSRRSGQETAAPENATSAESIRPGAWTDHWLAQTAMIVVGLALLVLGADWLVVAAVEFARLLGLSEMVIGLTIVSIGTSLPEVATSVVATLRGERDIAVGNVIGSSIFNILCVLGLSSLVSPVGLSVPATMLEFDMPVMFVACFACLPIFFTGYVISRWEGALFLFYYVAYTAYLLLAAQANPMLPSYGTAMLTVALPLTTITLAVLAGRQWHQQRR